jgi:hypothetical protein
MAPTIFIGGVVDCIPQPVIEHQPAIAHAVRCLPL